MTSEYSVEYIKRRTKWVDDCWKFIAKADYRKATELAAKGLKLFPGDPLVKYRYYATLADYALSNDSAKFKRMHLKAIKGMNSVLKNPKGLDQVDLYILKNEFFFQTKQFKKQYSLGVKSAKLCPNKRAYYSAGVGAAHYALELAFKNKKKLSHLWAMKSISSWEKYFRFEKKYYNPYVHLALAYGIVGNQKKMIVNLKKSARLCSKPMDYEEFAWVQAIVAKIPFYGEVKKK